jgi:hypothetical protein
MSRGALLIARNNTEVDYIKQAVFCANRISKFLEIPVSLITDNVEYLNKSFPDHKFDQVISISNDKSYTYKKYNDGNFSRRNLEFKNTSRSSVYDLTPYNETLLMDTDFILSNSVLNECFDQANDFALYKSAFELSNWRDLTEFEYISETGPDFYWATVVFFRKTETNKIFFDLLKHIQETWSHYRSLYNLNTETFRNDHAFSIAIHIMNGYQQGNFAAELPGTMYYTTDKDVLLELDETVFKFLIEYKNGQYFPARIADSNVHVMNKFSLNRILDNA